MIKILIDSVYYPLLKTRYFHRGEIPKPGIGPEPIQPRSYPALWWACRFVDRKDCSQHSLCAWSLHSLQKCLYPRENQVQGYRRILGQPQNQHEMNDSKAPCCLDVLWLVTKEVSPTSNWELKPPPNLPLSTENCQFKVSSISWWGRDPGVGNGNPLQCSCLKNPMKRGASRAIVMGSQRVGHDWAHTHTHTHTHTHGFFITCLNHFSL